MRTKNKISLWAAAIMMMAGVSCKKDFLDRNPLDSPSSGTFWTSESDVQTALAGVYSRLQSNFLGYQRVYLEGLSDNAYTDPANPILGNLTILTTGGMTSSAGTLSNFYSPPHRLITSANYFLDNVDKAPISDAKKAVVKAEVRFLRALAYFDLVQNFGDVIVYDHFFSTIEGAKIAKSPKDQVYAFINEDLDFAIANLPDIGYNGHAVKGSAQGIKARVLLTQQKFADAVPILQQIIASGKFGLSNDYAALFKTSGQAINNVNVNKEIMFSTQYLAPDNIQRNLQGMDLELGSYSQVQPYKDLVDEYEMKDGQPASQSPLYDPTNPYANRDPRLDLTIKLPDEVWKNPAGEVWTPTTASSTGFVMEKYVDLSRAPFNPSKTSILTDQDYIHLRYADILLMYAEAKNEVSGPEASLYDALDQVRQRPGINMPKVDQATYNTKEKLRDFIRHERRIELALEGQRYNDLKRWNIAHIKLPTLKTPAGTPLVFEQKNYVLPFPQSELDNNPNLVQNSGY